MKIAPTHLKPRNPLVTLAHFRRAGGHRIGAGAKRRQGAQTLRRELEHLKQSP